MNGFGAVFTSGGFPQVSGKGHFRLSAAHLDVTSSYVSAYDVTIVATTDAAAVVIIKSLTRRFPRTVPVSCWTSVFGIPKERVF